MTDSAFKKIIIIGSLFRITWGGPESRSQVANATAMTVETRDVC